MVVFYWLEGNSWTRQCLSHLQQFLSLIGKYLETSCGHLDLCSEVVFRLSCTSTSTPPPQQDNSEQLESTLDKI